MLLNHSLLILAFLSFLSLAAPLVLCIPYFTVLFMSFPSCKFKFSNDFNHTIFIFLIFIFLLQSDSLFVHLNYLIQFFVFFFFEYFQVLFILSHFQLFNINLFPFICLFWNFVFWLYKTFS